MSSAGVPYRKDVMPSLDYLDSLIASFKWIFAFVFSLVSNGVTEELYLSWRGVLSLLRCFSFSLRAYFLDLGLYCPEVIETIYLISVKSEILTALNGFSKVSRPSIRFHRLSFRDSNMLGVDHQFVHIKAILTNF